MNVVRSRRQVNANDLTRANVMTPLPDAVRRGFPPIRTPARSSA
jgi:hypothetical protein